MSNDNKRLFLAFEVKAHWPFHLPAGRIIPEEGRHMTLAFLGNTSLKPLKEKLQNLPPPPFYQIRKVFVIVFFSCQLRLQELLLGMCVYLTIQTAL